MIASVLWRVTVACFASLALSVLAVATMKRIGVDLKDMNQRTQPKVLWVAGVFNILFIVAVSFLMQVGDKSPLSALGFSFSGQSAGLTFVVLAGTLGIAFLFVTALNKKSIVKVSRVHDFWKSSRGAPAVLLGFLVLLIAALQEEVLFRGYFTFAMHAYRWDVIMIVSSLIFTVWHFLTNRVHFFQIIDWFLGGLMLFYVYHLTGSIIVATLIHFSRNFTNVLVFNITGSGNLVKYDKPFPSHWKTVYTLAHSFFVATLAFLVYA